MPTNEFNIPAVQLAAGGIVWRKLEGAWKLAVLHRPKYDDWSLPKGKPEPGEDLGLTAWREVREETGCDAKFLHFAGTTAYPTAGNRFKVVLFWHMKVVMEPEFKPNPEVDELLWLSPADAARRLSYPVEQDLLARASEHGPQHE